MSPTSAFKLSFICTAFLIISPTNADEVETYIVELSLPQNQEFAQPQDLQKWYYSFLPTNTSDSNEKPRMVHMYHHVLTGFAAKLSAGQAKAMAKMDEVISVRPPGVYQLHTTRTPHFLGLNQNSGFWKHSDFGRGTIIGLLDTGITSGHPSFDDKGVPPRPARWRGKCEVPGCNNKLIGMRNFDSISSSPLDDVGHGTHTSSTAAGSPVNNANVFGQANGTAIGMAPLAHVAMYKVCSIFGCAGEAVLAGMDAAIEDGVDVISISLGGGSSPFYEDLIAKSTFAVIQRGIFVSCSAGNGGPNSTSLENEAPWILTVGASSIDRKIRTTVRLGNKRLLDGESLFQPKGFDHKLRPLVYPGMTGDKAVAWCYPGSLDKYNVKGKVVLCDIGNIDPTEQGQVVKDAGGAGMIVVNGQIDGATTFALPHVLPASYVGYKEGVEIKKYINSTSSPLATILFRGTILGVESAPEVTSFSSRGPNNQSHGILKPDVVGPGLNILAAWPVSVDNKVGTKATFNVISGTSMSCPHLAGVAALLKSSHPLWSPAAIKSAIMTTARQVNLKDQAIQDERLLPADLFGLGAGHVDPSKANSPGLVFDLQPDDYIPYLCGLNYTTKQVEMIVKKRVSCKKTIPEGQLNYPSFSVALQPGENNTFTRKVTNVGKAFSKYTVGNYSLPRGISMSVRPQGLSFTKKYQKASYQITFKRDSKDTGNGLYAQGYMTWVSGEYSVRTPFSFTLI